MPSPICLAQKKPGFILHKELHFLAHQKKRDHFGLSQRTKK